MNDDARHFLIDMLRRHEGFVGHAYHDSLGYLTIGYGRLIDERRGGRISKGEAEYLLANDVQRVIADLAERAPWWTELDEARQVAIVNMAFQLGIAGLLQFRSMIDAIQHGDWLRAKHEALDSRWAEQTPTRAHEIAEILLSGALR